MNALDDMRAKRLQDEFEQNSLNELSSTLPRAAGQVDGHLWHNLRALDQFQIRHVGDQRFTIAPGYVEFLEVTFEGTPLRLMAPQYWPVGTVIVLEAAIRWHATAGKIPGGDNGVAVEHKDGRYVMRSAKIVAYAKLGDVPASSEGPPNTSTTPGALDLDWIRRFTLATIGDEAVTQFLQAPVYPMASPNAFDLAMLSFL